MADAKEAWEIAWDRTGLQLGDGARAAFRAGYLAGFRDADTVHLRASGVVIEEIPLTVHGIKMGDPIPPCACGTVEAWHNPGCLLYPEGGYPADQPWRGPPK